MDHRYADLAIKPYRRPVPPPARTQTATAHRAATRTVQRPHTPLAAVAADKAAVARSTSRLTHAGGAQGKRIAFNASV